MFLFSYFFFVNLIILLLIYLQCWKENIFLIDRMIVLFPGKIIIFKWSYSYISAAPVMAQNQSKRYKHLLFVRGNKFVKSHSSSLISAVQSVLPLQKSQSGMISPLKRPLRIWWKEKKGDDFMVSTCLLAGLFCEATRNGQELSDNCSSLQYFGIKMYT